MFFYARLTRRAPAAPLRIVPPRGYEVHTAVRSVRGHRLEIALWDSRSRPRVSAAEIEKAECSELVVSFDGGDALPFLRSSSIDTANAERPHRGYVVISIGNNGDVRAACDELGLAALFVGRDSSDALHFSNDRWMIARCARRAYDDVIKVAGGSAVNFSRSGALELSAIDSRVAPPTCPPTPQLIRDELVNSVRLLTAGRRAAVFLSGGIDSSAVAAAAKLAGIDAVLVHGRWPKWSRAFETELSCAVARTTGMTLYQVNLGATPLIHSPLIQANLANHHWFGWMAEFQRTASAIADIGLFGWGGEWFGLDGGRSLRNLEVRQLLGSRKPTVLHAITRDKWLEALGLRRRLQHSPLTMAYTRMGGKSMALANPYIGPGVPSYCAYTTPAMLRIASAASGTGLSVQKLALRLAFADVLPTKVTAMRRIGTTEQELLRHAGDYRTATLRELQEKLRCDPS